MSARIITKRVLIPGKTSLLVLNAPEIAVKAKPGNFVILRVHAQGERIPLTIADTDPVAGTITIVFLVVGCSTAELNRLKEGDVIRMTMNNETFPIILRDRKNIGLGYWQFECRRLEEHSIQGERKKGYDFI